MFSKKKTECRVCGYRFTPERENIYTAEEPRSALEMLTAAPTRFSAVDCPICGCQIRLADRAPRIDLPAITEQHDADAEDTDETERHVEREGISIIYSGRTLKPIRTTRGLVFIESRYLSPVADVLDVLELYERRTAEGTRYFVEKAGFLFQAVIMPYDVINQQFVESLQDLTRECEFSLSEKERREREARDRFTFTEPEQCSLNVDPDTGEVVEESEVTDNAKKDGTRYSEKRR